MKSADITEEPTQATDFIVQPDKELLPLDQFLREAEAYYLQKAMKLNDKTSQKLQSTWHEQAKFAVSIEEIKKMREKA